MLRELLSPAIRLTTLRVSGLYEPDAASMMKDQH